MTYLLDKPIIPGFMGLSSAISPFLSPEWGSLVAAGTRARRILRGIVGSAVPRGASPIERWPMPMRAIRVLLVVWVVVGLAFPATAQHATPRPSPPPAQQDTLCDAFTKGANGDWVAKKDEERLHPFGRTAPGYALSHAVRAAALCQRRTDEWVCCRSVHAPREISSV